MSTEAQLQTEKFASVANFSPFYRFCQAVFFLIYAPLVVIHNYIFFGIRIEGREHLKRRSKQGCILISNHSLYLDPAVIIHTLIPNRAYYFALKSHFSNPVGGGILRLMGGIPIPGMTGMRRAERTASEALNRGHHVHFFPEGEMKHLNQAVAPFQNGAFFMALRLNVPIIPVTLVHRPRTLFGKQISKHFIKVRCVVGEPLELLRDEGEKVRDAADRYARQAHQTMADTIISGHQKM